MKNYWIFILLLSTLLLLFRSARAQPPAEIFVAANEHYKNNRFDSASLLYSLLLAQGYENAEVHYNYANALFKLGELGKCILHYEKALKLSPDDDDIIHNLKLANAKTVDKIIPVPELGIITWWRSFRSALSAAGWGKLAILLIWIALAFFVAFLFTSWRTSSFIFGMIFLLASLFCLWLRFAQHRSEKNAAGAIILAKALYVKSAPDDNSTNLFMVHEGLKVQVSDKVGDWHKVRFADGKVGWVPQNAIGMISTESR